MQKTVRLLATSDIHGMMTDWDYLQNRKVTSGSIAGISSAVKEKRDDHTILIDAGDLAQGNCADLFTDEAVHPMIQCANQIGYDIWVPGNHDYDYGADKVCEFMASFRGKVLTGNVLDPEGSPIADAFTVIEKDGIRIGIIGMTTPVIAEADAVKDTGYLIKDPIEETKKSIIQLKGKADVLIAVCHMGTDHLISEKDTGVYELADACPELDVIIGAHDHKLINEYYGSDILIVENEADAKTMMEIILTFETDGGQWKLTGRKADAVWIRYYEPDQEIEELISEYDWQARDYGVSPVGSVFRPDDTVLCGPVLSGTGRSREDILNHQVEIRESAVYDHAASDLMSRAVLYYSGADISAFPCPPELPVPEQGYLTHNRLHAMDPFNNIASTVRMNGAQLKKYMEWCVAAYQTMNSETDPIQPDTDMQGHFIDLFGGVSYKINLAKPAGERIMDLAFHEKPVEPEDTFVVAAAGFRVNNQLLAEQGIFQGESLPVLVDNQVRGDIGSILDLMCDYIEEVNHGRIEYYCDCNWELVYEP